MTSHKKLVHKMHSSGKWPRIINSVDRIFIISIQYVYIFFISIS